MEEKKVSFNLSRREFLLLGGQGLAAMTVLAACGPQPAEAPPEEPGEQPVEAPPAEEAVTISYLGWPDTADLPAWEKLSEMYMERNPTVTIEMTQAAGGGDEHYMKLQTMVAGGSPPHIAGFQGWEFQPFADKGALAAIDDYVARDGFTDPFPEGVNTIEICTKRKGKLYLVPLQMGTMVMFYAKHLFDEAGVDYPTDDWTYEEFLDIAQKLTDIDARKYGLRANGIWPRDIHYIRGTGKQEFDELVDPHTAMFNQPEIVEAVQTVAYDVYHTLQISPTAADLEGGANEFQTGNCAMKYEGAWWFPQMMSPELQEQGKGIPFDVVLMPKQQDELRPHRGWSEGVCLMKSDQQEAAWEYVKFMAGEEGDKVYSEITGRVPNSFGLLESFWIPMIKERFGVENGKAFMEAFKRSEFDVIGGVSRTQMWNEVVKPEGWDPMLNGSATAAEVLPKVEEGVQAMLDEYWATQS